MTEFVLAVLAFVASHAVPALRPVRSAIVSRIGERAYLIVYSCISLGAIWWLASAYGNAPYIEVWPFYMEARWVPVAVMPVSCILLVAALTSPNPLSVQFSRRLFDPDKPGIVSVTRHPLLWAFILWAGAHLVPNGDVASLVLFGVLLVLSLVGIKSLDLKACKALGIQEWTRLAGRAPVIPFYAIILGRVRLDAGGVGCRRILAGLALYGALLLAHEWAIGVSPLPF